MDPARGEATEVKQSVLRGAALTRQLLAFSRRQASRPQLFALGDGSFICHSANADVSYRDH